MQQFFWVAENMKRFLWVAEKTKRLKWKLFDAYCRMIIVNII